MFPTTYPSREVLMSAYLYPELASKAEYKRALARGDRITAEENTPWGSYPFEDGTAIFEGPHYPKPHKYYGTATLIGGVVVAIK